jgi:predicted enzyme related to lactoylglutathione lyase
VPPTTLAVYDPRKAADHEPNIGGGSLALSMEDVDEAVKHLKEKDVNVFAERIETGVCVFALCTDPDGNMLWLHKRHDGTHG